MVVAPSSKRINESIKVKVPTIAEYIPTLIS